MLSAEADALDRDAQVFATLQELRQLLAQTESMAGGRVSEHDEPDSPPAAAPEAEKAVGSPLDDAPSYPAPAVALAAEPFPARRAVLSRRAVIAAGAVLLVVAVGYLASGKRQSAKPPPAPSAAGEVKEAGSAAETSASVTSGATSEATPVAPAPAPVPTVTHGVAQTPVSSAPTASAAPSRGPPAPAASSSPVQPASVARSGVAIQHEGRGGGGISAAPVASARPVAPAAGTGIERPAPPQIGPCTDAVAALGLCTQPAQRREQQ